jgi:hypothetical protein
VQRSHDPEVWTGEEEEKERKSRGSMPMKEL